MLFWSHPRCFGPLGKFQRNIKISIKTARVSRLSVSYDYVETNHITVSISGILPRNDNFDNTVAEVNKELSKMCKKEKLLFVDHNNINLETHLDRSKLHLNHSGYEKLDKNFVSFIRNKDAWLPVTSKKVYSDFDDFPTFAKVNKELVDQTSNEDLKFLGMRNLNKKVRGHLNINSIRNKLDFFFSSSTREHSLQISFY